MRKMIFLALALSGCSMMRKEGGEAEKKISTSDVPPAVMSSVNGRFPGASISSVEKDKENGAIIYDFELTQSGRKYESDIKDDGTIVEIEKQVTPAPAAVTKAVNSKYPGAKIQDVMEVNKVSGKTETPDHYEVTLTTESGKEKEILLSLQGGDFKE